MRTLAVVLAFALATAAVVGSAPVGATASGPGSAPDFAPAGAATASGTDRRDPVGTPKILAVNGDRPAIRAVFPNPTANGDRGEYVLLAFPTPRNLSGWSLSDGEDEVHLPGDTDGGRILVTPDPAAVRNRSVGPAENVPDGNVVRVDGFALSNGGERIELSYRNVTVDAVTYRDAPEREVWRDGRWHPLGATDLSVTNHSVGSVRAFALPDSPGVPVETLRSAEERILLAGYSFGSRRIADVLRRATRRGVRVRVLVDAAPVGGMTNRSARLLDSLVAAGVEVRAFGADDRAPYDFHHPKYAVVDDRVLVATENWKPAGTGGHSSRGWGVVVDSSSVASDVASVFRADARRPKSTPWIQYRANASLRSGSPANGSYPTRFRPRRVGVETVRVIAAPDNAERAVLGVLENATESVRIQQVSIGNGSFLDGTIRAARRGVRVRVLLSSAWYVREENRRLVDRLNALARREGLALQARLVDPRSRFEKVHAKGVIVDGDRVVVGSLNWNRHSARENRELAVILDGKAVGEYYVALFRADWRGGRWWLPIGALALLAAVLAVVGLVARRRIAFAAGADVENVEPGLY